MKTTRIRERYKKVPCLINGRTVERLPAHGADVLAVCDLADWLETTLRQVELKPGVPVDVQNWINTQLFLIQEP
jgi:hypothetical protein